MKVREVLGMHTCAKRRENAREKGNVTTGATGKGMAPEEYEYSVRVR